MREYCVGRASRIRGRAVPRKRGLLRRTAPYKGVARSAGRASRIRGRAVLRGLLRRTAPYKGNGAMREYCVGRASRIRGRADCINMREAAVSCVAEP